MTQLNSGGAGSRFRKLALASAFALTAFASLQAVTAQAASLGPITTNFEIDGNVVSNGAIDWNNIGSSSPYLAGGHESTGIIAKTSGTDPCLPEIDDSGLSGKLDGDWAAGGGPNQKSDLCTAAAAVEVVNVSGQNHYILYQNWTRYYGATGDLSVFQHLVGPADGRSDDRLIGFDYDPNRGGSVEISYYTWNGSTWIKTVVDADSAFGYNPNPPSGETSSVGTFGESAVDLTAIGLLSSETCQTFTTGAVISRTGNSMQAELQDSLMPDPITISNCSSLKVTKTALGAPADLGFDYTIDQEDGKTVADPDQLMVDPADTDYSTTGDPATKITATIGAGETQTWTHVLAQPDYQVKELIDDLPEGVSLDTISCVAYDPYLQKTTTTVIYEDDEWTGEFFPIASSSFTSTVAHCTIVNKVTSLTLNKVLPNNDGGTATGADFELSATGTPSFSGTDPDTTSLAIGVSSLVTPGTFTLSEETMAGYAPSDWECSVNGDPVTVEDNQVNVGSEQAVVCWITNDDIPATLTLEKIVDNADGVGPATTADFDLTFTGAAATGTGPMGDVQVTDVDVPADTYTLSETSQPGYVASDWSCVVTGTDEVVPVDDSEVVLGLDTDVTCSITNTYVPATLTLVKGLPNDDGGNATLDDFILTAEGPDTVSGVSGTLDVTGVDVQIGDYALSETTVPGYVAGDWMCVNAAAEGAEVAVVEGSIMLASGDDVTCTIVNDDLPVDLALTKSDGDVEAMPGVPFDYTITVTNVGERAVDLDEAVTVTDTLPDELIAVSGPTECSPAGQIVTCTLDPALFGVGGSVTLTLSVQFRDGTPAGTYTNTATVSTQDDNNPDNDTDTEDTPLRPVTDLDATKALVDSTPAVNADGDNVVDFGETFGYKIMVKTSGNAPQTNVVITDEVPEGLDYVAGSATCEADCTVAYDEATMTLTWTYASLPTDTTVALTFSVTLPPLPAGLKPGTYGWDGTNVATYSSDAADPALTNEVFTLAVKTIKPPPDTGADLDTSSTTTAGILLLMAATAALIGTRKR